ncbi:MAG: DUF4102 domain-containing protein [Planctomycetaceae bacterium]|nr:DUF4102 domain-containing protein [Planctomycetaceae bacterium]
MARLKFTEHSVEKAPLPPDGKPSILHWDDTFAGFGLRVGSSGARSFIVQKDINGRTRRVTIGKWPTWRVGQARERARELLVSMDKGIDPAEEKRKEAARGVTLDEAINFHQAAMRAKECAPLSIENCRVEITRHLGDWLSRPLSSISRDEVIRRHERVSERGKYSANRVLRLFRTVYNTAARRFPELPETAPTVALTGRWNKERRRQEPIPWARLGEWARAVDSIANHVRRDLNWFILFTGLRATDAKTVRWEHVNLGDEPVLVGTVEIPPGCIHRPRPKGGEDRAFTVPLSTPALEILKRRRDENHIMYGNDQGWAFPSTNSAGRVSHVAQPKEQRYTSDGRKVGVLPSPHRLRDTFATAAEHSGVGKMALKILMNHRAAAGDVTEGYINHGDIDYLRGRVEMVAAFLLERARKPSSERAEDSGDSQEVA